jgi:hypothetical protein
MSSNQRTLPQEAIWACQAEFAAAFKLATAHERRDAGLPHAELRRMAEMEIRAAESLWQVLAERGVSRPKCFAMQNALPTANRI